MATDAESYFTSQLELALGADEPVLAAAYLTPHVARRNRVQTFINAATGKSAYVAITPTRLLMVETRIGAFGPLLENRGVRAIDRSAVRGVHSGKTLLLELADGSMLEYQRDVSTRHIPGQADFFARIEELLGKSPAAAAAAASESKTQRLGLVVGVAIALLYVGYRVVSSH